MIDMRAKEGPFDSHGAGSAGEGAARARRPGTRRTARTRLGLAGLSIALLAMGGAGGCVKKKSDIAKPDVNTLMTRIETDPDARLHELQKQTADFAALVHTLPGRTPPENRDTLRQAFADLTQLLPLVQVGPHGGIFSHQVSVVADTQTLLSGGANDLSVTPIVDRGLRAVYNALDDAQHSGSVYYEDSALRATLDLLNAKLQEFDTAHGAFHDLAWAEALGLTNDAISRMVAIIADRLGESATTLPATTPAATEPASTPPAEPPATAPAATEPSGTAPPGAAATMPTEPGTMPATAPSEAMPAPVAPATVPTTEPGATPAAPAPPTSGPSAGGGPLPPRGEEPTGAAHNGLSAMADAVARLSLRG